jgi:hypothetical protein
MTILVPMKESTYEKLLAFRNDSSQTEDEIISNLIDIVEDFDDDFLSEETIHRIEKAREEYKAGDTYSMKQVMAELGDSFE